MDYNINIDMKTDASSKAKQIIEENIYCTLATTSLDGTPWVSPVFYGYDENFNIYWISDKDAKHSQLLRENPQVSIVIFNSQAPEGEGDGVYIQATVSELNDKEEAEKGVAFRDSRVKVEDFRVKEIEEVLGKGQWRVYKAVPNNISKLSDGAKVNGQYVDKRIDVELTGF